MSLTDLARHLRISVSGVGYAVERGRLLHETIITNWLIDLLSFLRDVPL